MQPFTCPQCGTHSTFDPRVESAHCPECDYTPSADRRGPALHPGRSRGKGNTRRPKKRTGTHQRLLEELLTHWNGSYSPDPSFQLPSAERAYTFFQDYQRALGEDPLLRPGTHARFVRGYHPTRRVSIWFVGGYLLLKQGKRAAAARHFHDLTRLFPKFADPWLWLSAVADDPKERIDYLEEAMTLEPAHPLARDALAVATGRISPDAQRRGNGSDRAAAVTKCPQCGGNLGYEPGAGVVTCQYCGHRLELRGVNLLVRRDSNDKNAQA